MTWWQVGISAFGGTSALIVLLGFFGKSIVGLWLNKDLENHKMKLQAEAESQLERLRVELQMIAREREIVFTELHEKRVEIVAKLYRLLASTVNQVERDLQPGDVVERELAEELVRNAVVSVEALKNFLDENRIWFTTDVCDKVEHVIERLEYLYKGFVGHWANDERVPSVVTIQESWRKIFRPLRATVPPAKLAVEDEFRRLMGVFNDRMMRGELPFKELEDD